MQAELSSFFDALLAAADARTPAFRGHARRVADYAEAMARELGLDADEVERIRTAGLLHDIGMISVPDAVVRKEGDLEPSELAAIRDHCRVGAGILEPLTALGAVHRYVLEHHERLNGTGYPDGKHGAEISLGGQVVGLAEVWAAMTEDRVHRESMSPGTALSILVASADVWFATEVVEALQRVVRAEHANAAQADHAGSVGLAG